MTAIEKVLVVGGGIAGLAAAAALARTGVRCDVVELTGRPVGAGITLLNRAVDALDELGVLDRFIENGVVRAPEDVFRYFDAAGDAVATPPMPPRPPSALPAGIFIYRPTMTEILQDAAEKAGAVVRLGVGIAELEQDSASVTATLTDGSIESYDLVIGADGVRSKTRNLGFGDVVTPQYSGTTMFRWVVDGVPEVGPVGFYQSEHLIVTARLADGRLYLAAGANYPSKPVIDKPTARQLVRERLESFTAPLMVELQKHLDDDTPIIVNDYDWLLTPDPWYRGRVLLIGDAAHATTAHLASGGGMALEDGVVVGQEFAAGGTVPEILDRIMKRRFERARLVVETSVEVGEMLGRGESVQAQNQLRGKAMGVLASPY